nr:151_t:CDS:2 [Entrophospora candida]
MFLTHQETLTFLTSLRQIKGDLLLHIFALQFSNTHTFICNKYLIAKKFEEIDYFNNNNNNSNNSQIKDIFFVNVSSKNDKPTQVNPTNSFINFLMTKIQPYLRLQQQQNQLHDNDVNGEGFVLYLSKTPSCIITFTGWILEYPVIYALDFGFIVNEDEDENVENNVDKKNNLGNQGLILFQLFLKYNQNIPGFGKEESSRYIYIM